MFKPRLLKARRGFAYKGITWPKDDIYRYCTSGEIKILREIPISLIKITDKKGNIINAVQRKSKKKTQKKTTKKQKVEEVSDAHSNIQSGKE